jgi:hypothetical protein
LESTRHLGEEGLQGLKVFGALTHDLQAHLLLIFTSETHLPSDLIMDSGILKVVVGFLNGFAVATEEIVVVPMGIS